METKLDLIKMIYEDNNLTTRDKLDLINEINFAGTGKKIWGALEKQHANSNKIHAYLKGKIRSGAKGVMNKFSSAKGLVQNKAASAAKIKPDYTQFNKTHDNAMSKANAIAAQMKKERLAKIALRK